MAPAIARRLVSRSVLLTHDEQPLEEVDHGQIGCVATVRQALPDDEATTLQAHVELMQQPRFADSGFGRNQDGLAASLGGVAPTGEQRREFVATPGERRDPTFVRNLEARRKFDRLIDPPQPQRLESLQLELAEVGAMEGTADQPHGAFVGGYCVRRRDGLDAGRHVQRAAGGSLVCTCTFDHLLDDRRPGRQPDPNAQRFGA